MSDPTRIGRASVLLGSGTIVSRILGFAKIFLLSVAIGNAHSFVADAYGAATIVPNSIYALIGGGLLTAVLVPQIIRASVAADGGAAYVNKLVTIAILAFAVIALAATLASPVLLPLWFTKQEALPLAVTFAYWSIPQIFFLGLYTVLGEVLNARRSFGPYTWAPVLNNVVAIGSLVAFLVLFGSVDGRDPASFAPGMIALLAGGATLGLAAQALILTLAWRRTGLRYRPDFRWRGVNLSATGRAAGWTFGMLAVTQIAGLIETRVASGASGDASIAAMSTAWLIFMLPHSIITVSLVTVFYPRMSEHAASGDTAALRADVGQTLRIVLFVLVLADVALIAAAVPFARFFQNSPADAGAMAAVLTAYLLGLVPFTALFVIQRCFYALADTSTPFRFTLAQVGIVTTGTILCALLPVSVRTAGIALVVSLGVTAQLGIAAILLKRRLGGLGGAPVAGLLLRSGIAAVPALAVGFGVAALLGAYGSGWAVSGRVQGILATIVVCVAVSAVFLAALRLLRTPELSVAASLLRARLPGRLHT